MDGLIHSYTYIYGKWGVCTGIFRRLGSENPTYFPLCGKYYFCRPGTLKTQPKKICHIPRKMGRIIRPDIYHLQSLSNKHNYSLERQPILSIIYLQFIYHPPVHTVVSYSQILSRTTFCHIFHHKSETPNSLLKLLPSEDHIPSIASFFTSNEQSPQYQTYGYVSLLLF